MRQTEHQVHANRLELTLALARREVLARYQGSGLGLLWSLITPLLMLGVFTFVFGAVFQMRWGGTGSSTAEFSLLIFCGLTVFSLFSEIVSRAPTTVLGQPNYIKKVVFPLEILPVAMVLGALFHAMISLGVLLLGLLLVRGGLPLTALWTPVLIAPVVVLGLGFAWFLASIGVYVRDTAQVIGTLVTALLFLSPIFYPLSAMPDWIEPYLLLNPVAFPIEQVRAVLLTGQAPDLVGWTVYITVATLSAASGYAWFAATRKGFADVV